MEWSAAVIDLLNNLGQKFGVAIDWTQHNIMPYLLTLTVKIVNFELCLNVAAIVISLLYVLIVSVYLKQANKTNKLFEWRERRFGDYFVNGNVRATAAILMIVGYFIFVPIFLVNLVGMIKCLAFPEMIIFEFIKNL